MGKRDGHDFRNPVGPDTFACFKRICIIERNINENHRENMIPNNNQSLSTKKTVKSSTRFKARVKKYLTKNNVH